MGGRCMLRRIVHRHITCKNGTMVCIRGMLTVFDRLDMGDVSVVGSIPAFKRRLGIIPRLGRYGDRLCGLVVRVPGYRS
jgi:hypothetical protein